MHYIIITIFILLTIQFWIFFKILMRLEKRISLVENEITLVITSRTSDTVDNTVATGLVGGLQKVKEDDDRTLNFLEMGRHLREKSIMNQNDGRAEILDTGGELIPVNLSKEEQEALNMWYDKKN